MRLFVPASLIGTFLVAGATSASALGLGRVSTLSSLGNPLELSVALSGESSDALAPECVSAEVFAGDNRVSRDMVRIRVNRAPDGTPTSLRLVTGVRIDEPVATVNLTLGCPPQITRRYVVFIDPPAINLAQSGTDGSTIEPARINQAAPVTPQRAAAAAPPRPEPATPQRPPTPAAPAARPPAPAETRTARARREPAEERARAAVPAQPQRKPAAVAAAPKESPKVAAAPVPRLRLESAPARNAGAPVREQSAGVERSEATVAKADAAVAAASAAASAVPPEAARLLALEERFNRLRSDNDSTKRSIAALEARLREARAQRFDNPLVYALAGLALLLLLGVAVLAMRLMSLRREQGWKESTLEPLGQTPTRGMFADLNAQDSQAPVTAPAPLAVAPAVASVGAEPVALSDTAYALFADASASSAPLPTAAVAVSAANDVDSMFGALPTGGRRDVSVDELIDLEQQADFFAVLGQDEAAIELLTSHVQSTGDVSPLPYLKLLEIHRRRGDERAYGRTRERFNRRFGVSAPEWNDESSDGPIEEHPIVVERLAAVWAHPLQAMELLESLLFQRADLAEPLGLRAYGDLLFLYSMARDRAEHDLSGGEVDLLLPLPDEIKANGTLDFELSLDLPDLPPPAPREAQPTQPGSLAFSLDLDEPRLPDTANDTSGRPMVSSIGMRREI